jgi:hypothetical protein
MAVVVVPATYLAALRNADVTWASLITTLTLTAIGFSVVWGRSLRGRKHAGWFGFGGIASAYLALSASPLGDRLPTTQLLNFVHDQVVASAIQNCLICGSDEDTVSFSVVYEDGTQRNFRFRLASIDPRLSRIFSRHLSRW